MERMIRNKWAILLLLSLFQITTSEPVYEIEDETSVKTEEELINDASFFTSNLIIGPDSISGTQSTKLIVEIQEGGFVVGERSESGFGIDCGKSEDDQKNSCYYDSNETPTPDVYRKNPFQLINGFSYVRLNDDKVIHAGAISAS